MLLRIFIGIYFSICASLSTLLVEYIFMDGPTILSAVSALFTFPFGLYFGKNYLTRIYNLKKSILTGILIMFLSLLSFYIFIAIESFISIPEPTFQEIAFAPLALFAMTLIFMGIIIFPTAAISGAALYLFLLRHGKVANKLLNSDATQKTRSAR